MWPGSVLCKGSLLSFPFDAAPIKAVAKGDLPLSIQGESQCFIWHITLAAVRSSTPSLESPKQPSFSLHQWRRAWAGLYFWVEGRARWSFSKKSISLETVGHNWDAQQSLHSMAREAGQTVMLCLQGFLGWIRWSLPDTSLSQPVRLC